MHSLTRVELSELHRSDENQVPKHDEFVSFTFDNIRGMSWGVSMCGQGTNTRRQGNVAVKDREPPSVPFDARSHQALPRRRISLRSQASVLDSPNPVREVEIPRDPPQVKRMLTRLRKKFGPWFT